ncbi:MAG: AtpZ/AtpI family protein [Thermodesulfobacteriota bacterium]|nr:AtpZ/AtpI family protein [Thermodesulfobacteriota bacterium]
MDEEKRQLFKSLGFLSSIGISLVVSMLIGLAMGFYLDQWLDTRPMFTLIMLLIGIIAGFRNVYILTTRELKRQQLEEQPHRDHDAEG